MMYANQQASGHRLLGNGFIFSLLFLFCSYTGKEGPGIAPIETLTDTVPAAEVQHIPWTRISTLLPQNGLLLIYLPNGDSLLIKRKDYEEYARKTQDPDPYVKTFTKVEIDPAFPGGAAAWDGYVKKNLHYPADALQKHIEGIVLVLFVVEMDGSVSGAEAVSGPTGGGLRDEAVRLVKTSGHWNTAIQNFRIVRAYKKQPVVFIRENTNEDN